MIYGHIPSKLDNILGKTGRLKSLYLIKIGSHPSCYQDLSNIPSSLDLERMVKQGPRKPADLSPRRCQCACQLRGLQPPSHHLKKHCQVVGKPEKLGFGDVWLGWLN